MCGAGKDDVLSIVTRLGEKSSAHQWVNSASRDAFFFEKQGGFMILSLQGCMAVGKTTAVSYLKEHAPYVNISYEDNSDVIAEVKARGLQKNVFEDYIEIQKLWIAHEIKRYHKAKEHRCSIMDFGAEEIEFYTLHYPQTIGENWDVEGALHEELEELQKCMPDRILFLDADEAVLRERKEADATRSRNFFEHHLEYFMPLKRAWFSNRANVDILRVDDMTPEQVGAAVKKWVDSYL